MSFFDLGGIDGFAKDGVSALGLGSIGGAGVGTSGSTPGLGSLSSLWSNIGGMEGLGAGLTGVGTVWSAYNQAKANADNLKFMKKMYNADSARRTQAQNNLDTSMNSLGDFNKIYGG